MYTTSAYAMQSENNEWPQTFKDTDVFAYRALNECIVKCTKPVKPNNEQAQQTCIDICHRRLFEKQSLNNQETILNNQDTIYYLLRKIVPDDPDPSYPDASGF